MNHPPKPLLVLAWSLGFLLQTAALAESVSERFERGKLEFEHKNFENSIQTLTPLLYPKVQLTTEDDIVRAREMLGLAYFYTGKEDKAKEEFTLLLYLRPSHRLDAFLIPPAAVSLFDQIWNDPKLKERLQQIERERQDKERKTKDQGQKPPATLVHRIYFESIETQHSRFLAFFPFGVGQFQNGDTTKGILLAASGGITLAANIVSYVWLIELANSNGRYLEDDISLAKGLQVTQYVALGMFAAIWIYGIIDANLNFESRVRTPYRQTKEEREKLDGAPSVLSPLIFPGGGGFGFETRF